MKSFSVRIKAIYSKNNFFKSKHKNYLSHFPNQINFLLFKKHCCIKIKNKSQRNNFFLILNKFSPQYINKVLTILGISSRIDYFSSD